MTDTPPVIPGYTPEGPRERPAPPGYAYMTIPGNRQRVLVAETDIPGRQADGYRIVDHTPPTTRPPRPPRPPRPAPSRN